MCVNNNNNKFLKSCTYVDDNNYVRQILLTLDGAKKVANVNPLYYSSTTLLLQFYHRSTTVLH